MRQQHGLTLVELMIAMLLTLMVAAGAVALSTRGRASYRGAESLARLQETADAALELLTTESRLAGYLGLAAPGTPVAGSAALGLPEPPGLAVTGGCGPSLAHDLSRPLAAADGIFRSESSQPLGCRPGPDGRVMPGTDTLTVRHALATSSAPVAGRLQLETRADAARLAANGQPQLGPTARWHDLEVSVFYVGADSVAGRARPSLRRKRLVGGSQPAFQDEELVAGIEDLQVEIGTDDPADGDNAVDKWVAPDATGAGLPRAVRIWVLSRSDVAEAGELTMPALRYANRSLPAERSRYRRQLASSVVELRNSVRE